MPYTMTRIGDGTETVSAVTDAQALRILRRALRLHAEVAADKHHTVTLTLTRLVPDGDSAAKRRTVLTLRPAPRPPRLTRTQYEDLTRIRQAGNHARVLADGRIGGMFCQLPPAAAARLFNRGLAVADGGGHVAIGIAGLLAVAAYQHPAWGVVIRPSEWSTSGWSRRCSHTAGAVCRRPWRIADRRGSGRRRGWRNRRFMAV